jgi:glycosyltransferase involved in cell wall biosynthesis
MPTPTIAFLTYDWSFGVKPLQPNGCGWYRCYLPMKQLKEHGWESGIGLPGFSEEHAFGILLPEEKAIHGWDIVVLKLIMLERFVDHVRIAKERGQKIVVDIDDHMEGLEETNLAYKTTHPDSNPNNNRDHYVAIIEQADALITSTPFLHDFYKKKYPEKPIFVVRNGIDLDRWNIRNDHKGWLPTFGWVGATPWRSGDLETLNPFFGEFLKQKHLKFHHAGNIINAPTAAKQIGIDKNLCTVEPMKTMLGVPELFRKIDVGIVPLRDVPFNHAKSNLKGLENAAAGVPFIASGRLPEYQLLADAGVGRIADTTDEWINHMTELLNPKTRLEERMKNREIISEKFSMKQRGYDWDEVFKKILAL